MLLAADVLERQPGATIVGDVKSSRVLFEGIARLGGRAVMAPSGYVLVRAAMLSAGAPLAGEMSGHVLFAEAWHGADDALYVAMRLLSALTRRGASLAEFRRALPRTVATPELRIRCPAGRKDAVVGEVASRLLAMGAKVDTTDGVRVTTKEGWWLLRGSGTESKLTARCEASNDEGLARLRATLARQLRASGIDVPMSCIGMALAAKNHEALPLQETTMGTQTQHSGREDQDEDDALQRRASDEGFSCESEPVDADEDEDEDDDDDDDDVDADDDDDEDDDDDDDGGGGAEPSS